MTSSTTTATSADILRPTVWRIRQHVVRHNAVSIQLEFHILAVSAAEAMEIVDEHNAASSIDSHKTESVEEVCAISRTTADRYDVVKLPDL